MVRTHLIASLLCCGLPAQIVADDKLDAIRTLSHLYQANVSRFDKCDLVFTLEDSVGDPATPSDASSSPSSFTAQGRYAFLGGQYLWTSRFSESDMARTATEAVPGKISNRLASYRMLTDAKQTLWHTIIVTSEGKVLNGLSLVGGTDEFFRRAELPLPVGFPASARSDLPAICALIENHAGEITLQATTPDTIDGRKTLKVTLTTPWVKQSMWLDAERGALPIRTIYENEGGSRTEENLDDIRFIPGRGWFPFVRRVFLPPARRKRLTVQHVDFDNVSERLFQLEFAAPIKVVNSTLNVSYPARTVWDLRRLPAASSPGTTRVRQFSDGAEPVLPGIREPKPRYFLWAAVLFTCGGIVLSWRYFRGRR
jgi:hypothetical protein